MRLPWLALVPLTAAVLLCAACMGGGAGLQQCAIVVVGIDRWEQTHRGPEAEQPVPDTVRLSSWSWVSAASSCTEIRSRIPFSGMMRTW